MPKAPRRKRCGTCGMLPRKGASLWDDILEQANSGKYSLTPEERARRRRAAEKGKDSVDIPKAPSRPPKSSPFHPDNIQKRGGGWEEELQKAMERDRIAEADKLTAAQIKKAAAADAKKRTKGKSIKSR